MKKIFPFLNNFIHFNFALLLIFFLLKLFEYFFASLNHSLSQDLIYFALMGLLSDIFLSFFISGLLFIPFCLMTLGINKYVKLTFKIIYSIIISVYISLIHYFSVQLIPLGKDFFAYSFSDIVQTVGASGEFKFYAFIPFVLFISIYFLILNLIQKIHFSKVLIFIIISLSLGSLFLSPKIMIPNSANFKNDIDFYFANNKLSYFIYQNYLKKSTATSSDSSNIKDFDSNKDFVYLSDEYPFLRIDNSKDVLGNFFNKADAKPNIVFIITESLSAAFTGRDAYLGSFTPFLDSLIQHSLYWKNFLSTSGRTFGVNPAIFGSLPFGEKGFLDLGDKAPDHISIISILRQNGYYSSFFYGGDPKFDMMETFFRKQKTDFILRPTDFGSSFAKFPSNPGGFSWGYADREVFRKSLDIINDSYKSPRLDIYMTLAMHSPFLVPNQKYYLDLFSERLKKLGIDKSDKFQEYLSYKEKYASILYTDDAIRYFINQYKKLHDFKNTIFFITGDHRMVEIPVVSKIDKFHVPLIIYSPLIKESHSFEAVSSHLDIAPTLLAYLRDNYDLKTPPIVHWLGKGIDVGKSFQNTHALAFMWDKHDLINYINRDWFVNENQLFRLSRNMNIDPVINDTVSARIQSEFNRFKNLNDYICSKNKLYPDKFPDINARINLIFNKLDDFENSANKNRSNEKYFSGNYSLKINEQTNPYSLFDNINLPDNSKKIFVLLKFKMLSPKGTDVNSFEIELTLKSKDNQILFAEKTKLRSLTEKNKGSDKWHYISNKIYLNPLNEELSKGSNINIKFVGNNRMLFIDDLNLNIYSVN